MLSASSRRGQQGTLPLGDQARASLHLPPAPQERRERASRLEKNAEQDNQVIQSAKAGVLPLPVPPRATAETALQVAALAKGSRPVTLG